MTTTDKLKEQLYRELAEIRQRIDSLELAERESDPQAPEQRAFFSTEREQHVYHETLYWAGAVLGNTLNYEKVLDQIIEQIERVVYYNAACIILIKDETARIFRCRGYAQYNTNDLLQSKPFKIEDIPALRTIQETGWPLATPYVTQYNKWQTLFGQTWSKSAIDVPLRTRQRLIGFLHLDSEVTGFYSQHDAEYLQVFANQAAIALENARLYDRARQEIVRRVKALKKERNFISAIFDTANALVAVFDLEGRIVRFNRACERTTGYTFEEVHGQPPWSLFFDPEAVEPAKAIFERLQRGEHPVEHENGWLTKDGRQRSIAWSSTILLDQRERVQYIVSTGIDITERKRVEEEREKLIEELDAFAHTVAHDLQTILARIIGFADILVADSETLPPESLQEYSEFILRNGRKMSDIIEDLLLLSGVRQREVSPAPLDMFTIVAEVKQRLADLIEEHQAEIILPESWLAALGYAPWVEEVWLNYLSNGIKYGSRPPRLELGSTQLPHNQVKFWVRDNGDGLSPEEQAKLFKPFTQLHQDRNQGHGLGLSIVRRIVEKLGGQAGVESAGIPGQGCLFSFTLPAAK